MSRRYVFPLLSSAGLLIINGGIGTYSLVLWGNLRAAQENQVDIGSCRSKTVLDILEAIGILEIIQTSVFFCVVLCNLVLICRHNNQDSETKIKDETSGNRTNACQICCDCIFKITLLVLAIVASVMVWGNKCHNTNASEQHNWFYQKMHVFLVIYWVVPFAFGVFLCCFSILEVILSSVFGNSTENSHEIERVRLVGPV
ncbi:hypothetical protein AKO1_015728 [Acrasis kona]|uniref:Uncharacterized protein n=1 Tax=Acrasis kona TaxID=1008807 RepID=A0AAW2ZF31_9EUKA